MSVIVSLNPEFAKFPEFLPEVITWLASSALCDVIITICLVYSLYRRKAGSAAEDHINRIIRLTMQTGTLTTVFALTDVFISVFVMSGSLNFIWDFPLSKLYTNSLISSLNARAGWQNLSGDRHPPNALFQDTEQSNVSGNSGNRTVSHRPQTVSLSSSQQYFVHDLHSLHWNSLVWRHLRASIMST